MPLNAIWRLIRSLFAVLGATVSTIARMWRRDEVAMGGFALLLETVRQGGWRLRYDGEDVAAVAARLDTLAWIARDPDKAAQQDWPAIVDSS